MTLENTLTQSIRKVIETLYGQSIDEKSIQLQATRKEFEGDLTLVVFPFLKISKKNPELTAQEIGDALQREESLVSKFNVIKGFLNLSIAQNHWIGTLNSIVADANYGTVKATESSPLYMVEYSSPNTNKPLHLVYPKQSVGI